jgi:putative transposase
MNPVRAGLVEAPDAWRWSSAPSHLDGLRLPGASYPPDDALAGWRELLQADDPPGTVEIIRQCTATGLPLGDASFLTHLAALADRPLPWNHRGRPKKKMG